MTGSPRVPWIVRFRPAPRARLRLLCFPYAGGGASAFRTWHERLPYDVEVCAIQPPGRESRMKEPPVHRLETLVEALVDETRPCRDRAFVLFGHSVGGLVAFELARALRRRGERAPVHLFVSGCGAPQVHDPEPPVATSSDRELLARLRRFDGTPEAVLEHPEMMELLLPTLRADVGLRDDYVYSEEPALDLPITALGGQDDPDVWLRDVAAWGDQTLAQFRLRAYPGGHFFIRTAREAVLDALASDLGRILATSCPAEPRGDLVGDDGGRTHA